MGEGWGVILGWMVVYAIVRSVLTVLYREAMGVTIDGPRWGRVFCSALDGIFAAFGIALYLWLRGWTLCPR